MSRHLPIERSGRSRAAAGRTRTAVGIATVGRAPILAETLAYLRSQTRQPDRIVVACTSARDIEGIDTDALGIEVIQSVPGLPMQRNAILKLVQDCDFIIFFDDDFLPRNDYIEACEREFLSDPSRVVITGRVIADGINGPGISFAEGRELLRLDEQSADTRGSSLAYNGYGCNMAFRMRPIIEHQLTFDESLPLYAWLEDLDFSLRVGQYGTKALVNAVRGVHLGVKRGRGTGVRLGYSQVANPIYLSSKPQNYPFKHAIVRIVRNVGANVYKSLSPEPWVDRRGRLRGNLLAIRDWVFGRMSPERALHL